MPTLRASIAQPAAPARLLPSGDAFYLLQGADRELLVPDRSRRNALWTSRVWPGALLVDGDVAGTWRRAGAVITVQPWGDLPSAVRDAVEAEATSFPLPGHEGEVRTRWDAADLSRRLGLRRHRQVRRASRRGGRTASSTRWLRRRQ